MPLGMCDLCCARLSTTLPPSVGLLLAIHLCLFTIIGMLLFTIGEKVSMALAIDEAHRPLSCKACLVWSSQGDQG